MEKEFVPYQQSLDLKELGFDEPCLGLFKFDNLSLEYPYLTNTGLINSNLEKYCSAPLYQQAFRWFREVYNIYVEISFNQKYENPRFGYIVRAKSSCLHTRDFPYKTYEEAELECLKKLIEIVKEKK